VPHAPPTSFSWFLLILLNIITWAILVKSANQEAPQCAVSCSPLLPSPILGPNVFLSYSILKHSQNGRPICAYFGITWYVWHCLSNQMNASIWFNEQCQTYHVTPKYVQIHLKDNNTCNIKTNIFRDTPIQTAIKPTNTNIKHDVVDSQNTTKYLFAKCLCTR
jgi:hypothetical protein